MKRPLIALVLVLAAATAQAETRSNGVAKPPEPLQQAQAQPAGPRSEPTPTVAMAVARTQIEKSGYSGVRALQRGTDGTWHANALNGRSTPVAVVLDSQGKVTETH